MDNIDPYKILGLNKNYDYEELKMNYKRVAKKCHPDKGGSEELFNLVTLCYKKLYEELKMKEIDKQFNDLKLGFSEFKTNQERTQRRNTNFNNNNINYNSNDFKETFNRVYDDHKISDPYDIGYGNMMLKSSVNREDINIKKKRYKNMRQFNKDFDSEPITKYNKKMIVYKEPEALPSSSKSLKYSELGIDNVKDFSTSTNYLDGTDYKKAHSTTRLADPRLMRERKEFRDINDLEVDRSNISYQMTEEDLLREAKRKKKEKIRELRRIEKQKQMDIIAQQNFEKINKLMLAYKR